MLDAVVIGTGFGGAVSACRLAQAKLKVCVLERGRRYPKGSFPRDWRNPSNGWLWSDGRGLYDVKPINEMTIVQAAGYGGGSLVYANVQLRPVPEVFADGWPTGYDRAMLDPYYDLVAYMLDIKPITDSARGMPAKTARMKKVAEDLGRTDQFCYPNLAVNFTPAGEEITNKHDVKQEGCNYCGECDIGCNVHAKNTLDLNYLAIAERNGAEVRTECEATKIEPLSANPADGYRVTVLDHTSGELEAIDARTVFVCAGAVSSTELLLRCRDEFQTLPALSARLGHRYSGNGDSLSFVFDTKEELRPAEGPTITTGLVVDDKKGTNGSWFIIEDGGCPKELSGLLQVLRPQSNIFDRAHALLRAELDVWMKRSAQDTIPSDATPALHSGVFLAMGRDRANGQITLDATKCLRVLWDVPSNVPLYDTEQQIAIDIAGALGGRAAFNPLWEQARTPVSVHNLGGCVMADSEADGVTDANGEIFRYPGLYVLDGGALPEATGVNPSHTIAAVAERNVELAIRKLTGTAAWQAPERAKAKPIEDPVGRIKIPATGTAPPKAPTIGLTFSEKFEGFHQLGLVPAGAENDHAGAEAAAHAGKAAGTRLEADITITMAALDRFLDDKAHAALLTGTIRADGITGPAGTPIRSGVFNLYPDDGTGQPPRLRYAMPFIGTDGEPYVLDGHADIAGAGGGFNPTAIQTVYATIHRGLGGGGPIVARGVVRLGFLALINNLKSARLTGNGSLKAKEDAVLRFLGTFIGPIAKTLVGPILRDA